MTTSRIVAGAFAAVAACALGLCSRPGAAPADPPATRPLELVTRLDRQTATPGEKVRIVELVPASADVLVRDIVHRVVKVAVFDRKAERLKNLKPERFEPVLFVEEEFADLPGNLAGPNGLAFDTRNPREKGMEFEFRPKHLGTYLIYTIWDFKKGGDRIESQPVLLVVRPPLDAQGRPVIKPEWVSEGE